VTLSLSALGDTGHLDRPATELRQLRWTVLAAKIHDTRSLLAGCSGHRASPDRRAERCRPLRASRPADPRRNRPVLACINVPVPAVSARLLPRLREMVPNGIRPRTDQDEATRTCPHDLVGQLGLIRRPTHRNGVRERLAAAAPGSGAGMQNGGSASVLVDFGIRGCHCWSRSVSAACPEPRLCPGAYELQPVSAHAVGWLSQRRGRRVVAAGIASVNRLAPQASPGLSVPLQRVDMTNYPHAEQRRGTYDIPHRQFQPV
jgi:hypothetical protein